MQQAAPPQSINTMTRFSDFSKFFLCAVVLFPLAGSLGQTPPVLFPEPLSPRIANYDIAVTLNPDDNLLHGRAVVTWKNTSADEISELQFHLYLNAFRNSESTFMLEQGRRFRGLGRRPENWGYSEINRMVLLPAPRGENDYRLVFRLAGTPPGRLPGTDLTPQLSFIQPDIPEHTRDRTVLRAPLPAPLPPGQALSLYIDFTAKLPEPPIARTGALQEFYFVGQWYPKLGVYVDGRWNCHQFHTNSEFFADFGVYNVWITVPAENLVGATGVRVGLPQMNEDGTATHFYHAEDVHDFAWTASPDFVEFNGIAQDVNIRVLMQKDHSAQGARHIEATKTAVEYFQKWYGDYPYPNVTVVDPRRGARQVGGVEYPTLFTAGTTYGLPEKIRLVEWAVIHEFGHNYWQGIVASNEFEEPWLDEGINTYNDLLLMNRVYGPQGDLIDFLGLRANTFHLRRWEYLWVPNLDPMLRRAWEFASGGSYAVNAYAKPGLYLMSLHHYLGEAVMRQVMATYLERWKFRHPRSADFVRVIHEVSGQDLTDFFTQAFHTTARLDYGIGAIYTRRYVENRGFDFEYPVDSTSGFVPVPEPPADSTDTRPLYDSGFTVRRLGEFRFPVVVEAVFEDGSVIRESWDGRSEWKKFRYLKPVQLVSATVDPDQQMVMDINYTNNSKTLRPARLGVNKIAARAMFWTQFLLDQPELLNLLTIFSQ